MSLINIKESTKEEFLENIAMEGKIFLKKLLDIDISIAISDIHEGMAEIRQCYEEAQTALRYRYLLGEDKCITYKQIKDREFDYMASVESKLSKMVISYVKDASLLKTPEVFTNELLEMYGINEQASLDTVECFKYEMLSVINKAFVSNKGIFI